MWYDSTLTEKKILAAIFSIVLMYFSTWDLEKLYWHSIGILQKIIFSNVCSSNSKSDQKVVPHIMGVLGGAAWAQDRVGQGGWVGQLYLGWVEVCVPLRCVRNCDWITL